MGAVRKALWAAGIAAGACGLALAAIAPRERGPLAGDVWDDLRSRRYAHRGLYDERAGRPENSRAAFRAAAEAGFGIELDVHLMADGNLVVIHDSSLERMCGRAGIVERLTLDELEGYRLAGSSERPPLLDEVLCDLEDVAGDGPCASAIIEIKASPANAFELARKTMACLDAHRVPFCVQSFDPRVLLWLRVHRPEVIRGQLSERHVLSQADDVFVPAPLVPAFEAAAASLAGNVLGRPDYVAYRFEDRNTAPMRLLRRGFDAKVAAWTIRDEDSLAQAEREGLLPIFDSFLPS